MHCPNSSVVEHSFGMGEVVGSTPTWGSINVDVAEWLGSGLQNR